MPVDDRRDTLISPPEIASGREYHRIGHHERLHAWIHIDVSNLNHVSKPLTQLTPAQRLPRAVDLLDRLERGANRQLLVRRGLVTFRDPYLVLDDLLVGA